MFTEEDIKYMKRALHLAKKAEGFTSPNPMVGSVIVKNGKIISEGFHKGPGLPHAEAEAINNSKYSLNGATLYVNLEPCCHKDKRTPPCIEAILKTGIKRVVIGMVDPNPKVSGMGIEILKRHGIMVDVGLLEKEAKRLNEAYIKYIVHNEPFVILKIASTLDGKIATERGESRWITSERSRLLVHKLRSRVDAVMTAIGTVKADNPELTSRIKNGRDPVRVIIDPDFETPRDAKILITPPKTIIFTKKPPSEGFEGVKFIKFEGEKLNLKEAIRILAKLGITSIIIEGGSSLNEKALRDGIVDKVMFFISPKIIGGRYSYPSVGGESSMDLQNAYKLKDVTVRRIGEDILIEGYIESSSLRSSGSS